MGFCVELGGCAVSVLREYLAKELAQKVQARGIVIWEDAQGVYDGAVSSLDLEDVRVEVFGGSWYELRQSIETAVAAENPPKMVVYTPGAPDEGSACGDPRR